MTSAQPDTGSSQQPPDSTSTADQVEGIRRLYLAATLLVLRAVRAATARALRGDTVLDQLETRRLHRTVQSVAVRLERDSRAATLTLLATAEHDGAIRADRDAASRTIQHAVHVAFLKARADTETANRRLVDEVHAQLSYLPARVDDTYQRIVRQAFFTTGDRRARARITQRALNEFAERGITVFTDRSGREWPIDSYAEMAVRTVAENTRRRAYMDRLAGYGITTVQVITKPGCCGLCAAFSGATLSTVASDKRTTFSQAVAAGGFHPNCRCTLRAVHSRTLGTRPTGPQPDSAQAVQAQRLRYLERRVRAAKRRLAVALDEGAQRQARRELSAAFAAIRQHVDDTGLTRQRAREQINGPR